MKNKTVLVVAPHPDDETLGCGGTLLLLKNNSYHINWMIVTEIDEKFGFSKDQIKNRNIEISEVSRKYGFDQVIRLEIPTTMVDQIPEQRLVGKISQSLMAIEPNIIFLPFINDVHTDHKRIAEAVISSTKWFRCPSVEKLLYYETISETDYNIDSKSSKFAPSVYVDISLYLDEKVNIMNIYKDEINDFPFPRSEKAIRSLAYLRGSQCGAEAAESFELLRANIRL